MVDRLRELEARQDELTARLAAASATLSDVHPNIAGIYRGKVERLAAALDHPRERDEVATAIRGLIERIVLTPGVAWAEMDAKLVGDLGTIIECAGVGFEPTAFRLRARGPASNNCCWARGIGENQGRTSQLRCDPFLSTASYQKSLIEYLMPAFPRDCSFMTASASPVRTKGRDHYAPDVQLFVLQLYCIASGRLGHGCDASLV